MKNKYKKSISLLIIMATLFQMGCAGKKTTVMSLDEARFDKNYKYSVKLKTGETSGEIPGSKISHDQNETKLQSSSRNIIFPDQDIQSITGQSIKRTGSHAGEGALIGVVVLGTLGTLGGFAVAKGLEDLCEYDCSDNNNTAGEFLAALMYGSIGAAIGGLIGGGIGLAIPKHDTVQITPVVSTSKTSGTTAGGSVQFRF